jgi:hypothetical protein
MRFMGLLAVFFIFDFAINFLSALLRAAKEQAYLLKVTAAVVAGFGVLLLVLPSADGALLLGTFITAQAAWAFLLLTKVVGRWPSLAVNSRPTAQGTLIAESSDAKEAVGTSGLVPRLATAPSSPLSKGCMAIEERQTMRESKAGNRLTACWFGRKDKEEAAPELGAPAGTP